MTTKRDVKMGIAILALIGLLSVIFFHGEEYDETREGLVRSIDYEYVNLRVEPNIHNEPIAVLEFGDKVTLTGYTYSYFGAEDLPTEHWTKVIIDNQEGWVVTESIAWP